MRPSELLAGFSTSRYASRAQQSPVSSRGCSGPRSSAAAFASWAGCAPSLELQRCPVHFVEMARSRRHSSSDWDSSPDDRRRPNSRSQRRTSPDRSSRRRRGQDDEERYRSLSKRRSGAEEKRYRSLDKRRAWDDWPPRYDDSGTSDTDSWTGSSSSVRRGVLLRLSRTR